MGGGGYYNPYKGLFVSGVTSQEETVFHHQFQSVPSGRCWGMKLRKPSNPKPDLTPEPPHS